MSNIITRPYNDFSVSFNDEGWINATDIAEQYGKRLDSWMKSPDTIEYIAALRTFIGEQGITHESWVAETKLVKAVRGRGTWLHPKLAVAFARWIDPRFAVWCDMQMGTIIRGKDDWRKLRHANASVTKVANSILQQVREAQGKETESHHYSNEARLVNWALSGEFKGVDRDSLSEKELDLLAHLQERNAVLIGRGVAYDQRKPMLKQYSMDWRMGALEVSHGN
jgi:KilA-N domain